MRTIKEIAQDLNQEWRNRIDDRKTRAFCLTPKADGWGFKEKHAKHNLQVNP